MFASEAHIAWRGGEKEQFAARRAHQWADQRGKQSRQPGSGGDDDAVSFQSATIEQEGRCVALGTDRDPATLDQSAQRAQSHRRQLQSLACQHHSGKRFVKKFLVRGIIELWPTPQHFCAVQHFARLPAGRECSGLRLKQSRIAAAQGTGGKKQALAEIGSALLPRGPGLNSQPRVKRILAIGRADIAAGTAAGCPLVADLAHVDQAHTCAAFGGGKCAPHAECASADDYDVGRSFASHGAQFSASRDSLRFASHRARAGGMNIAPELHGHSQDLGTA